MNRLKNKSPLYIFTITLLTFIAAYYTCILFHEWFGHGLAAWMLGEKASPFDIYYGGWALQHVDENVDYANLMSAGRNVAAAIIAINGVVITGLFFIISLILLSRKMIQRNKILFTFFYWTLVINVIPLLQYFTLTAFSSRGDVGHFTHGLNISPWWIFIPGTIVVIAAISRILIIEVPKAYAVIPLTRLWSRRALLFFTLFVIFLMIYTHGFNPLTDTTTTLASKFLVLCSILSVPLLLWLCDPSRK